LYHRATFDFIDPLISCSPPPPTAVAVATPSSLARRTLDDFPPPWTTNYFSILIVRVVVAPHFLQAYVKSHRSVSSETATGGDGVIGRLQPGQVTVG
jgi:hypothetical protein